MSDRPRKARRALARQAVKEAHLRERVYRAAPGGSPELPIEVPSSSVVEVHARGIACPLCGGELRVDEHAAEHGLRVVRAHCTRCGVPRVVYFRLPSVN